MSSESIKNSFSHISRSWTVEERFKSIFGMKNTENEEDISGGIPPEQK